MVYKIVTSDLLFFFLTKTELSLRDDQKPKHPASFHVQMTAEEWGEKHKVQLTLLKGSFKAI